MLSKIGGGYNEFIWDQAVAHKNLQVLSIDIAGIDDFWKRTGATTADITTKEVLTLIAKEDVNWRVQRAVGHALNEWYR